MIKVWDYLKEYETERSEIMTAIQRVLESGTLILGENVRQFEQEFASYCGLAHGIGVNSGTDAIFLALKALGVGPNDEVITVSNTAVPTVSAIEATGALARFVDIDPKTLLMDTAALEQVVSENTKCIVVVHLFGQCVDMQVVSKVAEKHSLLILEDCAQAHGARQTGLVAGNMSDISAFSFYPTKILGGFGDGGMILTSDNELQARCQRLRFYGMEQQYFSVEHGYNSRLDELHAAILREKLKHIDAYINRRREIAAIYRDKLLNTELLLPHERAENFHSYYLFVCRHSKRDSILDYMRERDIHLNVSYRWPIHIMPAYEHLGYQVGDLPETETAANEIFSLPMYPSLTDEEVFETCHVLKDALAAVGGN